MAKDSIQTAFPLTPLQEGMLYHTLRDSTSGIYHGQTCVTLEGPLDPAFFRKAWERAAELHEAFRTFFAWERRERPLQVVRDRVDLDISFVDWRKIPAEEQEARWATVLRDDRLQPFDLTSAPLMRLAVMRTGEQEHRLLWSTHHALLDGWSGMLILQEVLEDYAELAAGRRPLERPAPPSFARFVGWLEAQDQEEVEAFWRSRLEGVLEPTIVLGASSRGSSTQRLRSELSLSEKETRALMAAAARLRVTLNTLTVAAWALLLQRYGGGKDVVFGLTQSERPSRIPGVERAAGLYLSTVPLRITVSEDAPVSSWIREVQREVSDARAHGAVGLTDLQRWSGLPRGAPLMSTLVTFEGLPVEIAAATPHGPLHVKSTAIAAPSDLPISMIFYPEDRLRLELERDPAAVSERTGDRLLAHVRELLRALVRDDDSRVGDLSPLGSSERARLLDRWSVSDVSMDVPTDVTTLFESRVDRAPDAVALRTAAGAVSYAELERSANRLAHCLVSHGLRPGSLVGVLIERSPDAIVAMLGTLKAGCAYVPLDPTLPSSRLEAQVAALDRVILPAVGSPDWPDWLDAPLRLPLEEALGHPATRLGLEPDPSAGAYVIFTSGSTGEPKGVVVERGHLAWSTGARFAYYREAPSAFLLLSALTVDSSIAGIYWTLCGGGVLVLPPPRAGQNLDGLSRLIESARVTHTLVVPSLHRMILEHVDPGRLRSLRVVAVAGEECAPDVLALHRHRLPGVDLHNEYGPSEATVWATVDELTAHEDERITIGRPVPSARVYVLDSRLRPTPTGVPGELCIGGPAVARGYLNDPDLSDRVFMTDPFAKDGRLYRTGDRARFADDGRLEFLGRIDHQVKVRGFRVETAEVERALEEHPHVREAAVVLRGPPMDVDLDSLTDALISRPEAEIEALLRTVTDP